MQRRIAVGLALALLILPATASADEGALAGVMVLGALVPSSIGVDTQHRVPVGWPFQISLGSDGVGRFVVAPRAVFWTDRRRTTFDMRAGLRANGDRLKLGEGLRAQGFVGLGSTVEFVPVARPLLSPEVGVRFGDLGTGNLGTAYVDLQGDFGAPTRSVEETPAARGTLAVGWSFF